MFNLCFCCSSILKNCVFAVITLKNEIKNEHGSNLIGVKILHCSQYYQFIIFYKYIYHLIATVEI